MPGVRRAALRFISGFHISGGYMSAKRWTVFLFMLTGLAGVPCTALAGDARPADDLGHLCTFHRPTLKQAPAERPKFNRVADVAVNGARAPAYSLSLTAGGLPEGGFATYRPDAKPLHVKFKTTAGMRFDLYAIPTGTIFVPSGWTPRSGAKGADGSFYIVFAPDVTGKAYLYISNTAACVGCAYSSASEYFESARALAKKDGFAYCRSAEGVHIVALNPVQRAFRIDTDGNPVDGLAYFNPDDDLMFYEVEVSLPVSQHALATVLLNQFVIHGRSK
jgi:hypothetical protein